MLQNIKFQEIANNFAWPKNIDNIEWYNFFCFWKIVYVMLENILSCQLQLLKNATLTENNPFQLSM